MPSIKFDTIVETAKVVSGFRDIQNAVHQTAERVEKDGKSIDDVISNIQNSMNIAIGGWSIGKFVNQMMQVRGQFQQTEMAFKTMLQSEEKADALMKQLIRTAAVTPFGVEDVTEGAKQLLAFNVAAEDVNKTLIGLGDVAAGMGLNLKDLVMLYGTTIAKGKMDTMDLYQFLNRGIPIADEIAKVMGLDVTNAIKEVQKQIKAGKVTSDIFIQAMQSMTAEGSKFGGLMEAQSKTITGQISNIKDAIEQMFNDLGTQTEGLMNDALDITSKVIDHWKEIGEVILAAASAIGLYKAMAVSVAAFDTATTNAGYAAELSALESLLPMKEEAKKTDLEEAVAKGQLSAAQAELVASKREEVAAYVAELQAQAKAKADAATAAAEEVKALENKLAMQDNEVQSLQDAYDALESYTDGQKVETAEIKLNTAVNERNNIAKQLHTARETAATAATEANTAANTANTASQGLNTAATARDTAAKGIWAQVTLLCKRAQDAWNASMFSSPLFWIAATIAAVTYAVYKLATAESAHETAVRKSNEAWDEFDNKVKERQQNIESLIRTIQSETATEYEKAEAYQKLSNLAPQLTEQYSQAQLASADFAKTQKEVAESMDELKYDKAVEEVEKFRQEVESLNKQLHDDAAYNGGRQASLLGGQLQQAQEDLDQAEEKLSNIIQLRDQAAENAKPIEVRLQEAQENESVRQEIFDFYDEAINLANDWQAANETINYATGESRLDAFINKAQKEIAGLREDIKNNPADLNLRMQESEKTKVLNNLLTMKRNWAVTGATTIPLIFKAQWNTAKQSLNQAKKKVAAMEKRREKEEAEANAKKNAAKAKKAAADAKKQAEDRKKAQEDLNNRLKALQQKNTDETISLMQEGTEKKLAQIKNDYAKRNAEIDKQEAEFKKKNKEAGKKATLTSAQSNALNKARDLATQEYNKKLDEVNREALTSMRDYLKEYGSLYQQKQAIAEEYEEKIAKAQTQGEKLSLQQQRKKDLQTIEINAIRQNIDWGSVFGDFGAMFKDQLEPTIEKLQELSKSTTDVNEQKTIQELISKLQGSATVWDSDIFKKVSDDINSYQSAMQGYIDAQEREIEATKAVTKAQEDLAKAKKSGDKTSISKAEGNLSRAQNVLATASNNVLEFGSSVQKASSDLQTSAQKAVSQFQQLENGLQGLTSESLKGIGNSILGLDKLFGGSMQKDVANTLAKGIQGLLGKDSDAAKSLTKALGDSGMAGEIISAILGILDILKDGFGTLISNLMDTVFGAVTGILDDALSGDIVMKPLKSIGNNVSHILNTLSFGGFNSLFGGDGNSKKVQEAINNLTSSNERLQKSIDKLKDTMTGTYGKESTNAYKEAKRQQETYNHNVMEIAKQQMSYHGSHHSWSSYWSGFSNEQLAKIRQNVKSDFNGDITTLTPEEMKKLLSYQDLVDKIRGTGKHYKGRSAYGESVLDKLEDYADLAGNLDELTEQWRESITQISFDSMKDNFISNLMDMSKSAQDFSDDFAEMMQKALLSYSMEDLMNGKLKKLYEDWADAIDAANGDSSKIDIEAFNKRYDDIVQEGLKRRDDWAKVTGYTGSSSSSQTATSGGWASMGQDTADELNGRFTALQIAGESIAQNMTTTISQMESIVTLGISTNGAVLEIRNMMIMTNSYLEDIVKYSKLTYNDFGTKLDDMNRRLKDI